MPFVLHSTLAAHHMQGGGRSLGGLEAAWQLAAATPTPPFWTPPGRWNELLVAVKILLNAHPEDGSTEEGVKQVSQCLAGVPSWPRHEHPGVYICASEGAI